MNAALRFVKSGSPSSGHQFWPRRMTSRLWSAVRTAPLEVASDGRMARCAPPMASYSEMLSRQLLWC